LLLDEERRRRDISTAAVIREAVERYLVPSEPAKRYGFIALGEGEETDAGARMEELLAEEWGDPTFDRDPEFCSPTDLSSGGEATRTSA
jgi:hypothetical protein